MEGGKNTKVKLKTTYVDILIFPSKITHSYVFLRETTEKLYAYIFKYRIT